MSLDALLLLSTRSREGDAAAEAELSETLYPHLRRIARRYLAGERRGHTLQTTELVNEAWLRLFGGSEVRARDRAHVVALMARQMRRVLVDHARHRNAAKGPGAKILVSIEDEPKIGTAEPGADVLAVHEALCELESVDERAGKVVELRFFGGLLEREAAEALGVSLATLKRDWTFARAWLLERLTR